MKNTLRLSLASMLLAASLVQHLTQASEIETPGGTGHPSDCPCLHAYDDKTALETGDLCLQAGLLKTTHFYTPNPDDVLYWNISPSGRFVAALTAKKLGDPQSKCKVSVWSEDNPNPQWTQELECMTNQGIAISDADGEVLVVSQAEKSVTFVKNGKVETNFPEMDSFPYNLCAAYPGSKTAKFLITGPGDFATVESGKVKEKTKSKWGYKNGMIITPHHSIISQSHYPNPLSYCLRSKQVLSEDESKALRPPLYLEQILLLNHHLNGRPMIPDATTGEVVQLNGLPLVTLTDSALYPHGMPQTTFDGRHMIYKPITAAERRFYPRPLSQPTPNIVDVEQPQLTTDQYPALTKVSKPNPGRNQKKHQLWRHICSLAQGTIDLSIWFDKCQEVDHSELLGTMELNPDEWEIVNNRLPEIVVQTLKETLDDADPVNSISALF